MLCRVCGGIARCKGLCRKHYDAQSEVRAYKGLNYYAKSRGTTVKAILDYMELKSRFDPESLFFPRQEGEVMKDGG